MAIVKMKKLRVMALAECREDLLGGLQHLGCVEISEPNLSDPAWSALLRRGSSSLAQTRTEIADAHTALAAIKQHAKVKDGLFIQRRQVSEQEFLDPTGKEQAKATVRVLTGSMDAHNTFDAPETVDIADWTDFRQENGILTVTVPACSVTAITLD